MAAYELSSMRSAGEAPFSPVHTHDSDPAQILTEQRRTALAEMDEAPFSYVFFLLSFPCHIHSRRWFHVKVVVVAGAGFFTDA
jgi:hypothetical protein